MKRVLFFAVAAMILAVPGIFAQESPPNSPDRRFTEERLHQTELSLVAALESKSPGMQASAAQTVRELKGVFPDRSFARLVIPLMRIVKDENADVPVRILAALALSELHSAMGDFAIKGTALFTDDGRMRHLCTALTLQRLEENRLAHLQIRKDSTGIAGR